MRTLVWLGWVGVVGCRFELPHGDGDVAADPCDSVASGTQVGDEGTTAGGWRGQFLVGSRLDAPAMGQILVEGPIDDVPELWVDGSFSDTLSTDTLRYARQPYDVRSVILPPDGGWPVGVPLEVHTKLPTRGYRTSWDSGAAPPDYDVLAFQAVDGPAPTPNAPSWLQFQVGDWDGNERVTTVTAHLLAEDAWATVRMRDPNGDLFGLERATAAQVAWLWESRLSCEERVPLPCVEVAVYSATGEPGPTLSECAPAQGG